MLPYLKKHDRTTLKCTAGAPGCNGYTVGVSVHVDPEYEILLN